MNEELYSGFDRYEENAMEYTNIEAIRKALVGRSIVRTGTQGASYDRVLSFVLDDGTTLKAHATDGGCGCSNGCFTVEHGDDEITGTILNVELVEEEIEYDFSAETTQIVKREVEPGSIHDGSSEIRIFVYTEFTGKSLLVESEGGDNGYYGWGFWLSVHPAND